MTLTALHPGTQQIEPHMQQFSLKQTNQPWKTAEQILCSKRLKRPHQWGFSKTPPPAQQPTIWRSQEEPHKYWASSWGYVPTSGTPTLQPCTREMSPQNIWFWKPVRLAFQEKHRMVGNRASTLRVHSQADSVALEAAQKQQIEKHLDHIYVREIHLLTLSNLRVAEACWDSLKLEAQAGTVFAFSLPCSTGKGRPHFCILPLPCGCRRGRRHFWILA